MVRSLVRPLVLSVTAALKPLGHETAQLVLRETKATPRQTTSWCGPESNQIATERFVATIAALYGCSAPSAAVEHGQIGCAGASV